MHALQTQFQDYLLTDKPSDSPFCAQAIGHLDVYYEGYRLRLQEVLELDYPKCKQFLGDAFEKISLAYIKQYPSHHFSVRYFGQHFSAFLSTFPDYDPVSELADFEWSILFTLDAKDAPCLTTAALQNIPPENWGDLIFKLHPSVQYKTYNWDTPKLWKNLEAQQAEAEAEAEAEELKTEIKTETHKNKNPVSWLLWRKEIKSLFESLPPAHILFYQGIVNNKTFGEICEDLFEIIPEDQAHTVPATAVGILQYWIEQGVIVTVDTQA